MTTENTYQDTSLSWPTLTFICDKSHVDTINEFIQDIALEENIISVSFTDAIDEDFTDIFEPELNTMPFWDKTKVSIMFNENINLELIVDKLKKEPTYSKLIAFLETSKTQNKKEYYEQVTPDKPIYYGKNKNLILYPTNQILDSQKNQETKSIFNLSPGLAFGTGQHETTSLCLNWLANNIPDLIKNNPKLEMLDFGCGSGILSIAAAKLNIKAITAIDHDPQAIIATQSNSLNNNCDKQIQAVKDNNIILDKKVPILIANILANPLINLSSIIINHVTNSGYIVLSGILKKQAREVILNYTNQGMILVETTNINDWVCLVFKKQDKI